MPPFSPWLHEPIPTNPEVYRTVGTYSTYSLRTFSIFNALSSFPSSSPNSETEAVTCELFNQPLGTKRNISIPGTVSKNQDTHCGPGKFSMANKE